MPDDFKNMIGRKLKSVELSDNKEKITFRFKDGFKRAFGVDGDCCSHSWIEHLEKPKRLSGAVLLSVEDSDGIPWDGHECEKSEKDEFGYPKCGHDCLSVYHTVFKTSKGNIILEYRNDSNGYYGGYLVDAP